MEEKTPPPTSKKGQRFNRTPTELLLQRQVVCSHHALILASRDLSSARSPELFLTERLHLPVFFTALKEGKEYKLKEIETMAKCKTNSSV